MTNDASERFAITLRETTMRAAAEILVREGRRTITPEEGERATVAMRLAILDGVDELLDDLKLIQEARMGEAMMFAMLNATCVTFAANGLRAAGLLAAEREDA